jgi:hypothetical protein
MENEATGYGISETSTPVQATAMTLPTGSSRRYESLDPTVHHVALQVIGSPADAKESGGLETEQAQPNPDHFREEE